jgi:hypothetical protein
MNNNNDNHNIQSETTHNHITAPPRKDIFNAASIHSLAACVVLTFAFVAIFIQINPANAEQKAQLINDIHMIHEELSLLAILSNIAIQITKIHIILYSAFKKAIAQSLIYFAIFFILSVHSGALETEILK